MNTLERKAEELFRNSFATPEQTEHNKAMWIRANILLGDKHLLAVKVQRKDLK